MGMATEVIYEEEELVGIRKPSFKSYFNSDNIVKFILLICAFFAVVSLFFIIYYLFSNGGYFFTKIPLTEFFFDRIWFPTKGYFGAYLLIIGTILVSIGAMIIAIPLGIACAIFIAEIAPKRMRKYLKLSVELLSGIPSVVYGYFGFTVLNPWIMDFFNLSSGDTWLSGSIILGIMALPTIVSVCEDAISSVPNDYREASLAMGSTKWQTISKAIVPAAMSGITAGIILGLGRAIGETIAVVMITGNRLLLPNPITDVFSGIRTITAAIALEFGEATGIHVDALFALAIVLFLMTLIINTTANIILGRLRKKFQGKQKKKRFHLELFGKLKENATYSKVKLFFVHYKKYILYLIILGFFTWVFYTWFGILTALLITAGIIGLVYLVKSLNSKKQQIFWYGIITFCSFIVILALSILLFYIISKGLPVITKKGFLTDYPRGPEGGIMPAIVGTFYLIGVAVLVAVPIGILSGIYLAEYSKEGKVTKIIRAAIDNLNGTPSIVFGLFGAVFFVLYLDLGISILAGGLTLALMILPTIIRTTEESVKAIPQSFREGSLALGSTKWQSIYKTVLPSAIPGIITGIILGMGRAAGETAPIMFTAATFTVGRLPTSWKESTMALSFQIYILILAYGGPEAEVTVAGAALTLLIVVFILYGSAFIIRNYYKKKKQW
jgi:phosphate transport system permease protein